MKCEVTVGEWWLIVELRVEDDLMSNQIKKGNLNKNDKAHNFQVQKHQKWRWQRYSNVQKIFSGKIEDSYYVEIIKVRMHIFMREVKRQMKKVFVLLSSW